MTKSIPRGRSLRRSLTSAEAKLGRVLRNRTRDGWKFRRRHPVDRFIVDLARIGAKLIVDGDGATRSTAIEIARDSGILRLQPAPRPERGHP